MENPDSVVDAVGRADGGLQFTAAYERSDVEFISFKDDVSREYGKRDLNQIARDVGLATVTGDDYVESRFNGGGLEYEVRGLDDVVTLRVPIGPAGGLLVGFDPDAGTDLAAVRERIADVGVSFRSE